MTRSGSTDAPTGPSKLYFLRLQTVARVGSEPTPSGEGTNRILRVGLSKLYLLCPQTVTGIGPELTSSIEGEEDDLAVTVRNLDAE